MLQFLKIQLQDKGVCAPLLLVYWETPELYYQKFYQELWDLCEEFSVDRYSIHRLERDSKESHKISQVKVFLEKSNTRARQSFQVFVFEDFWRLTPQSQNACLKFIEEPWEGNIVILTASSEQGILDTILSRVQIYTGDKTQNYRENPFFLSLIQKAILWDNHTLISYFFSEKREKEECLDFLKTLLYHCVRERIYLHLHEKLHDDIVGIESNNFIARSIVDIYILEL